MGVEFLCGVMKMLETFPSPFIFHCSRKFKPTKLFHHIKFIVQGCFHFSDSGEGP